MPETIEINGVWYQRINNELPDDWQKQVESAVTVYRAMTKIANEANCTLAVAAQLLGCDRLAEILSINN